MTHNNVSNNNRELDESKSLEMIESEMNRLIQEKSKVLQKRDHRTTFLKNLTEWGYGSPTEFIIQMGFIPPPSVKKPRTVITEELRQKVVEDLKLGTMTSKEVSVKHGIPVSSVDNIKGHSGLTKPRTKTVKTPTESVSPSNVTPMVESPELRKEVV